MKYINHDTNAADDEKLAELLITHGYEGYGLFWATLEKIAKQEKPIKTEVLKKQLKVGKRLEKCWSFMESIGLIYSNNGETFNKQLLNYAGSYSIKKEKTRERVAQFRERQEDTESVTRYTKTCNAPKEKESKEKESKENSAPVGGDSESQNFQPKTDGEAGTHPPHSARPPLQDPDDGPKPEVVVLPWDTEQFSAAWTRWRDYKKREHRFTYKSVHSEQAFLKKLAELSDGREEIALKILDESIANGWEGIFPLKNVQHGTQQQSTTTGGKFAAYDNHRQKLANQFSVDPDKGGQPPG